MDQENKNTTGAPSDDTTSALFVSARKKQLEQQEKERRAKEKEEQRLAAEAEVRRLEREVEERRRKAEQDARLAEEEARRIAEEARAKKTQAAENPDSVLGAQPEKKELKIPQIPKVSMPSISKPAKSAPASVSGGEAGAKPPLNIKMLAIIGGGAVVVILILVVILSMGGGSSGGGGGGGNSTPDESTALAILNEYDILYYMNNGEDVWYSSYDDEERVRTAGYFLEMFNALGEGTSDYDENTLAQAVNEFYDYYDDYMSIWDAFCHVNGIDGSVYRAMVESGDEPSEDQEYDTATDGYVSYTNSERKISFSYPEDWELTELAEGKTSAYVEPIMIASDGKIIFIFNYTEEYEEFLASSSSDYKEFLRIFTEYTISDINRSTEDASNVSFGDHHEYSDGSQEMSVSFSFSDNVRCLATVAVESDGDCYAVFAAGTGADDEEIIFSSVTDSIVIN